LTKLINLSGHVYWGHEKLFEGKKGDEKSHDIVPFRDCYAKKRFAL
jgi:hypothetical protein